MKSAVGKVFLVGAGPGDPELITLRGMRALQAADVVLYDRLVHPALLDYAPTHAKRVYAGRSPGEACADRQPHIHDQMIAYARLGQTIVRLKGGDPFVFGRGGEEMLALARAGIPFEVIPGVSSAISVPGSALVPVTHRGVSAAFGVFTAHEASSAVSSSIDWSLAARMPTAVFLMGALRLETIVDHLVRHRRRPDTPAIAIERGTLADQRIYCGTLADIREVARDLATPATLVVGEVVALRHEVLAASQPRRVLTQRDQLQQSRPRHRAMTTT